MPLTISCLDLGSPCDDIVSGNTMDELIEEMCQHALQKHNEAKELVYSEENLALYRSAVRQSARPAGTRTSKLDV